MKPKEKARELYDKYYKLLDHQDIYWSLEDDIKELLNVLVNEIIDNTLKFDPSIEYWKQVKQEIEKL